jgi:hypothetical protein
MGGMVHCHEHHDDTAHGVNGGQANAGVNGCGCGLWSKHYILLANFTIIYKIGLLHRL